MKNDWDSLFPYFKDKEFQFLKGICDSNCKNMYQYYNHENVRTPDLMNINKVLHMGWSSEHSVLYQMTGKGGMCSLQLGMFQELSKRKDGRQMFQKPYPRTHDIIPTIPPPPPPTWTMPPPLSTHFNLSENVPALLTYFSYLNYHSPNTLYPYSLSPP